jgi:hypothetical protein
MRIKVEYSAWIFSILRSSEYSFEVRFQVLARVSMKMTHEVYVSATYPARRILLDFITLIIFDDGQKLQPLQFLWWKDVASTTVSSLPYIHLTWHGRILHSQALKW